MKLLLSLPFVVLAACSSGPSKEESVQIYAAATTAMTGARAQAVTQAHGTPLAAPTDLTLDFTGPCTLGGTVSLQGSYTDDAATQQATFDLSSAFAACHEPQGTIDGDMHWSTLATGTSFSTAFDGDLDWDDGNNAASCAFDMQLSIGAGGVTSSGTLCGYDVADLSLAP